MAAGFSYNTDLYDIFHIVQNTMLRYPKDLIVASLKDFFSQDSKYHFSKDVFGYPNTPDLTDIPLDAGLYDNLTTRVFIGEYHRFDVAFYPAILIKAGSFRYVPISMNMDLYYVENTITEYTDGYTTRFVSTPDKYVMAGAWEGSIEITVISRGVQEADDLTELVALYLQHINWHNLYRAGVAIKPDITVSAPSESEDRNDKKHQRTITVNVRGEWRREIPISNIVDIITFCVEFGNIQTDQYAPNIEVHTEIDNT